MRTLCMLAICLTTLLNIVLKCLRSLRPNNLHQGLGLRKLDFGVWSINKNCLLHHQQIEKNIIKKFNSIGWVAKYF
ncbi:hypothetical protein L2E82_16904 [Cichorium intybus]|uniref:Uncharacterized protein n=2 Tax=Cichorium intybus TaxID=13427 RepID=A0ACB9F6G4_CICIN|nr:hypothetical protein L2E82_27583 [Cichorium intybus]KAI3766829.1 hypothetical protein L2E82_16904 [Cichorium intybus]